MGHGPGLCWAGRSHSQGRHWPARGRGSLAPLPGTPGSSPPALALSAAPGPSILHTPSSSCGAGWATPQQAPARPWGGPPCCRGCSRPARLCRLLWPGSPSATRADFMFPTHNLNVTTYNRSDEAGLSLAQAPCCVAMPGAGRAMGPHWLWRQDTPRRLLARVCQAWTTVSASVRSEEGLRKEAAPPLADWVSCVPSLSLGCAAQGHQLRRYLRAWSSGPGPPACQRHSGDRRG